MQYLITPEEYRELVIRKSETNDEYNKVLQELCTKVCDYMPIKWSWGDGEKTPIPWGCILSKKTEWYCDECPVQNQCPYPNKNWSK